MYAKGKEAGRLKLEQMTVISNQSGSKKVNITKTESGMFICIYVQVYNNEQQVLDSKRYSSLKIAEKWANKQLN